VAGEDERVRGAVEFAESSAEPPLDSLYEHLYVLDRAAAWYAVDERSPEPHRGEREEVEEWREKDPIETFAGRCVAEGALSERKVEKAREEADRTVREAVEFAEASPEPPLDSLYEGLYVLGGEGGWYAVDERSPEPHRGEREETMPDAARELAEAGAAYAGQAPASPRPNPASDGDAELGVEPEVAGEVEDREAEH